jgi:hypothetical protein
MNLRAILRVIDHFVPLDVLTSVLVVFSLENLIDSYVSSLSVSSEIWILMAVFGLVVLNLASMDEEEMDELEDDFEDIS